MAVEKTTYRVPPGINVAPLVDVCLVLLIVFVALTPKLISEVTVRTQPRLKCGGCRSGCGEQLGIRLSESGEVSLNGSAFDSDGEFRDRLAERLRAREAKVVFLRFSDDVSYGRAAQVFDLARQAGAHPLAVSRFAYDG